MHTRAKSHLSKFKSKSKDIRESSPFIKHIENKHGGLKLGETFEDYFDIEIVKAYSKPLTRIIEEGTFIVNYVGEVLNSKNEWHQPKIIRTTITQGGAEMAGGEIRRFPVNGSHTVNVVEAVDVQHVERTTPAQASPGTTGRITRARARANGGI